MAYDRTAQILTRGTLDRSDFALLLRVLQLTKGRGAVLGRSSPYKHIVLDEVQDYSPIELATMLSVVNDVGNLTLVGDTTQRVEEGFPGWEKLSKHWTAKKMASNFLRLDVSHRSTKQIIACASAIGKLEVARGGGDGERPTWMFARSQEPVIGAVIDWLQRITRKAPNALIGVICFSPASAKEAYRLLKPTFGPLIRLADEGGFSFEEGILVCDAYAAKGLEFFGVMVYQPVLSVLPKGEAGAALLYIAATRAQEYLAFASWGAPAVVASCPAAVLERIDLDIADEEDEGPAADESDG
jgi:DNA helicase-2/ATP-dependent DNA helicase PcrA